MPTTPDTLHQETVPEWLNESFVEKALKSYKHDESIKVSSFKAKTSFSEHYASSMFQCEIRFNSSKTPNSEPEILKVVIKVKPTENDIKSGVADCGPIFENEIRMYKETIPAMYRLFEKSGLKVELAPEAIYIAEHPHVVIILKDMSPEGFSAPREPPENFEDSKIIAQRLAQFHAASFYLAETNEHDFSDYNFSIYDAPDMVEKFFGDFFESFIEAVASWEGYEDYIPKLDYFRKNLAQIGKKSYVVNKPGQGYNVLNHADFHPRNTLTKVNAASRLEKFLLIDFQTCIYCSPCVDLGLLMNMIKREENGEIRYEELLVYYHEEFVNTLKQFGYLKSPPSLLDLNIELLKYGGGEIAMKIAFISFSFIDWNTATIDDVMMNPETRPDFQKKLYNSPACKRVLQNNLKSWVHKGWL